MAHRGFLQKNRRALTRYFAVLLSIMISLSESAWNAHHSGIADALFLTGLVLVGIAAVGRLWCSLHISGYKTNTLITVGPYSLCRNPLYAFSLLGGIGVGLASETFSLAVAIGLAFLLYYPLVVRAEERNLRELHRADFEKYLATTPRFWPSFRRFQEPPEYVVRPRIFRRAMRDALLFVWAVAALKLLEALHEHQILSTLFRMY